MDYSKSYLANEGRNKEYYCNACANVLETQEELELGFCSEHIHAVSVVTGNQSFSSRLDFDNAVTNLRHNLTVMIGKVS